MKHITEPHSLNLILLVTLTLLLSTSCSEANRLPCFGLSGKGLPYDCRYLPESKQLRYEYKRQTLMIGICTKACDYLYFKWLIKQCYKLCGEKYIPPLIVGHKPRY